MESLNQKEVSEQENQDLKENKKQGRFKDACDVCNTFNYCKGFNGKVLCPSCIKKEYQKFKQNEQQEQLSIFDLSR